MEPSFNNTAFHHPQMGTLGPHPRYSHLTDGRRVDGADIQYRLHKVGMPPPYQGASYVREANNGAPVETVWSWGHPNNASSAYHLNSRTRVPAQPRQYEAMAHPLDVPAHMQDLNFVTQAHHPAGYIGYGLTTAPHDTERYIGHGVAPHRF
eukprot:TRINITY_DN18051_c0_g1_i1.p2 TRINITY_DN18051_c0_g1~~TRINITY_DN18051_c0_g1_i1.p2  ORF type:complete len:151 (-),score=22.62 TRINITY_DN18051_c0_g1_i1:239-691(-)